MDEPAPAVQVYQLKVGKMGRWGPTTAVVDSVTGCVTMAPFPARQPLATRMCLGEGAP